VAHTNVAIRCKASQGAGSIYALTLTPV